MSYQTSVATEGKGSKEGRMEPTEMRTSKEYQLPGLLLLPWLTVEMWVKFLKHSSHKKLKS